MDLDDVQHALTLPRPGLDAQMRMAPRPRTGDRFPLPPAMQPREAGVLILLFPRDNGWHFFLTRRTDTVETHKGQIALPGGSQEPGETLAQTAVRETAEELGIARACIEILGAALSPLFVPVSGFRITPFVAFAATCPTVAAEPSEVTEVIYAPLDVIVDEAKIVEEQWLIRELPVTVPFYSVHGHKVWGATAMILSEFGAMLRQAQVPSFEF